MFELKTKGVIDLEVALSTYIGLFIVVSLDTFILFTVASFFIFGISQMIKKRELVARGFIKKNFQRVGIFSLLNGLSATAITAWWLLDFVPKEVGGALVGPFVIIISALTVTTFFWLIVLIIEFVLRIKKIL